MAGKSHDRREAIIEVLADHVLAHGIAAASLRPLARAAAISDRMLLYYFADKAAVMAAVLARVAARMQALMLAETGGTPRPLAALRPRLAAMLLEDRFWPYMRLWLEIAALAARGDAEMRPLGEAIGRGFFEWGKAQLDSPDAATRQSEAAQLLVFIEGQMLLKAIGMADIGRLAGLDDGAAAF